MRRQLSAFFPDQIPPFYRIVIVYIAAGMVWLLLSSVLIWKFGWHPAILTSLRFIYFVGSVILLSFLLRRERALADVQQEYKELVDNLLEPVLIHQQGIIVKVNRLAVEVFEAKSEVDLVGKPILEMVHPEYRKVASQRIRNLMRGQSTQPLEEKFLTLMGNIRDVEITGIPIRFHGRAAVLIIFRDVTLRTQAVVAVRNSERRLRTLIDALPDKICFVDNNGRWIEANAKLLHTVGLSQTSFHGKTALELANLCAPEHRENFLANSSYSDEVYQSVTHFKHETTGPDGTYTAHEITRVPVSHSDGSQLGIVVIARDMSEQQLATRLLEESEQRYRSLFENDGDMVVSVDTKGVIQSANPATETVLGYTPQEITNMNYGTLVTAECAADADGRFLEVLEGVPQSVFVSLIRKDGRVIDVHEKKIPILSGGKVTGFFSIVRDVTEQKAAEELLVQSERLAAIGQMAAGIAHEIRNPLTVLKGFVDLMYSSKQYDHYHLEIMQQEFDRIESIVNELLVFAKPTRRLLEVCDCTTLIQDVVQLMTPEANLRNIVIKQWLEEPSLQLLCEKNRMKQVLINLVKNAIDAVTKGGSVVIGAKTIDEDKICMFIQDNGPGIADAHLSRIGELFYTTKEKGTGLGLMVSRKIVEAHQGTLRIFSEQDKGTQVDVILPGIKSASVKD